MEISQEAELESLARAHRLQVSHYLLAKQWRDNNARAHHPGRVDECGVDSRQKDGVPHPAETLVLMVLEPPAFALQQVVHPGYVPTHPLDLRRKEQMFDVVHDHGTRQLGREHGLQPEQIGTIDHHQVGLVRGRPLKHPRAEGTRIGVRHLGGQCRYQ
jgi:hypothetical protein